MSSSDFDAHVAGAADAVQRAVDALKESQGESEGNNVEALKQARTFFFSQGAYAQAAICAMNLGDVYWNQANAAAARTHYETAKAEFELAGLNRQVADANMNLAMVSWGESDMTQARLLYLDALSYYDDNKLSHEVASAKVSLAGVHEALEEHDLALAAYKDALAYYEREDNERRVGQCLLGIGRLLLNENKFDEAEPYFLAASHEFRDRRQQHQFAECMVALADIYHGLGRNDDARKAFEEARKGFAISQ
ncbi:tetratricopeptide repeat protein [Timonella sp. A28]|uniref:tetratricopeptide repeat protein n=1 Tax=Timonella sp. A28 TaxID=3442640 RepID=UPI003EBF089D